MDKYLNLVFDSGTNSYQQKLLIGTATTGNIRMEWHMARSQQIIPPNWQMATIYPQIVGNTIFALRYPVADAQNIIVRTAIENDFEWLFLHEHDVLLPPDGLLRLNEYMRSKKVPVVSGLYYTRSRPAEPMVYRGRGQSYYEDWEVGDKVWVDGCPTGCLLIHCSILKCMWQDAEPYNAYGQPVRRVFETPAGIYLDPESRAYMTAAGTSDLNWCLDVMTGDYFAKAGWDEYADMEFPFLIDTGIFCGHINPNGEQFPTANPWDIVPKAEYDWEKAHAEAPDLGVHVSDDSALNDRVG